MKHLLAATVFLALSACATAPGGGSGSGLDTAGLIDRYDLQALRSIMDELDYTVSNPRTNSAGKPSVSIEAGDLAFEVTGESCDGAGPTLVCPGIQFSAQFAESDEVDADELIAKANRTLRPAKLFRARDTIVYERYLIMDGGVSRENLKTEISVYVEILTALYDQFNP